MTIQNITAAFNLRPDASIVLDGDHGPGTSNSLPFDGLGIQATRLDIGSYHIAGPSISWPEGWKASVYRDENDEPTIRIKIGTEDGQLTIACTDPQTALPKDIEYLLTLRVAVTVDVADPEPKVMDTEQVDEVGTANEA